MPAIFTDERKERIFHSIVENGIKLFGIYGVKKTTVDELAAKSSIAKGSFYNFFPSKEHLLLHSFIRVRERIAEEMTAPVLQTSGSPEESIQRLLQAAPTLPVIYPIIKEYYKPGFQSLLFQIAEELNINKREFTPAPNFGTVMAHWRFQGFTIDANPQDLEQAVEVFSSHTAVFGDAVFKKGINLLVEFSSIGSTGFIREGVSVGS
ncbi:MAG: TetR/AcrR family transcriptional regulator [Bacteroidetes bacterium]|nr:TetR/AcrR family transcriptional regulator [Bacteroidota bacterium]